MPAAAGTTGTLNGTVTSQKTGAPIAGAQVTATSPSQVATAISDASGRFSFLSLAPDTYSLAVSMKDFEPATVTGVSIFADQVQNVRVALQPSLRTIARVTSRSSMDVVKSGTTSDVYSVNATMTRAAQGLGGGGNLTNAYSAIAMVPGAFVPPGQQGWAQVVYIRGGNYDQIGYEFDGVPVNRSFDNYPGGTAGTLGQQQLQVYTGGGTVGESTSGLAGFINQVIKTGTFPGYAGGTAGVGSTVFYHQFQAETGGASPDRLFSYYAGVGGYNQNYRYLDQFNGAPLTNLEGYAAIADNTSQLLNFPGVYPSCITAAPATAAVMNPFATGPGGQPAIPFPALANGEIYADPGCYGNINPSIANVSNLADREGIFNFHFGIPHKHDGGKDDVQLLYNVQGLFTQYYSSANDIGPNIIPSLNLTGTFTGTGYYQPVSWGDFATWPVSTSFGQNAKGLQTVPYLQTGSPSQRCANVTPTTIFDTNGNDSTGTTLTVPGACPAGTWAAVPNDAREGYWNNASIVKVQYQHNMGSSAFLRFYGYTFYSDWLQSSPLSYGAPIYGFGVLSYDYELNSHTAGAALDFEDQIDPKNLISFNANYTTAKTLRYNNTNFNNTTTADATNLTNGKQCFAFMPGTVGSNSYAAGQVAPCNSPLTSGTFIDPTNATLCAENAAFPNGPNGPNPQCLTSLPAGASWQVTNTGQSGFLNTVTPKFTTLGLQDRWVPSDKLDVDLGVRYERYEYDLANTSGNGQNFWFAAGRNEFCYDPATNLPVTIAAPPASGLPANPFIGFTCPAPSVTGTTDQTVHPDGLDGHLLLSNVYNPTLVDSAFTPRLAATYTVDPNTVLRFSAGVFAQAPQTYQVQYASADNNLAYRLFQAFWQYGFTTPRHDPQVQLSNNYDLSYEHRFKGTDVSLKLTPYYRYATNQLYNIGLPFGLGGALNSGTESAKGVEFEITKGDFDRNGFAFLLSYTYLNAQERYGNFPGTSVNPVDAYNNTLTQYNLLTKAGGGAQCYVNDANIGAGTVLPDPSCAVVPNFNPPIYNPYYDTKPASLYNRSAWYPVGLDYPYLSPNTLTLVANYKRNRFAISPSFTLNEGAQYGNAQDVVGLDPRTCTANSTLLLASSPRTNPLQADYTSCSLADTPTQTLYIPNPQTGHFDGFGEFRQPNQFNLSLNMSYVITPKITANLLMTNLVNACFGGSATPWTSANAPSSSTCGYVRNSYYIANFYNGTSPSDVSANGVALNPTFAQSYLPAWADTNAETIPGPFNAYLQVQFKL
jgi:hypothetical protein